MVYNDMALKGVKFSEEHKNKLRLSKLGGIGNSKGKHWKLSEEAKQKISERQTGSKRSKETKLKISLASKGKKKSKEHKNSLRLATLKRIKEEGFGFQKGHKSYLTEDSRKKISDANKGDKAYNWIIDRSLKSYPVNWTNTLKRSIRERDRYTCQLCSKQQEEKIFDIHHIDYNKNNCNPNNLITLCRSCHMKTNGSRNKWVEYFTNKKYL